MRPMGRGLWVKLKSKCPEHVLCALRYIYHISLKRCLTLVFSYLGRLVWVYGLTTSDPECQLMTNDIGQCLEMVQWVRRHVL